MTVADAQAAFIAGASSREVLQPLLEACLQVSGAEAAVLTSLDATASRTVMKAGDVATSWPHVKRLPCVTRGVEAGEVVLSSRHPLTDALERRLNPLLGGLSGLLTAAVQAQVRTAAQERALSDAIAALSDGSFEWDIPSGAITCSPRFFEMMGLEPRPQITGWASMVHPEDLPRQEAAMHAHSFGGAPLYFAEYRCQHAKTRQWMWFEVRGRIVTRRADGTPLKLLGTHTDITSRKDLEARLTRTDRLASLGTMAAGVAHEINNPLAFMHANLEYARRTLREPLSAELLAETGLAIEEALQGTARISTIVRGLRLFSRASAHEHKPVQVSSVVKTALLLSGAMVSSRGVVETGVPESLVVLGDEHELVQVLVNLLLNATQAMAPGTSGQRIRVTAQTEGALVRLEVRDTGPGIAPENLRKVFEPFFTTKPIGEGTGLGLSICHSLVTAHGGDIGIHNLPEGGCCVTVRLPAASWRSTDTPVPPSPAALTVPRARVLVVDDEPLMRSALVRGLSADFDVVLAANAHEALSMLGRDRSYDVVLCDVMMAGLGGLELYERVKETAAELAPRMVFLTGGAWDPAIRARLEALPNERLLKPVSLLELREVIHRCVAARASS
jgi:signal transduction histidine kinase